MTKVGTSGSSRSFPSPLSSTIYLEQLFLDVLRHGPASVPASTSRRCRVVVLILRGEDSPTASYSGFQGLQFPQRGMETGLGYGGIMGIR